MEMELSNRYGSPRVNLGFVEPWTEDVFALGFVKLVELCRGLPRAGLGFYEPVRITKCEAWVCRVCSTFAMLLHIWHSSWVVCTGGVMACSCIYVTLRGWHILET